MVCIPPALQSIWILQNLVMVTGDDPVQAVYTLKDYIVHTHAKDGRRNYYRAPEEVYGLVEAEMLASPSFTELPL